MATIRQYATQLEDGEPGRRFRDLYEFRQAHPPRTLLRVGLWLAALVLIVGVIRIGGHLPYEAYDVQTDVRDFRPPYPAPLHR